MNATRLIVFASALTMNTLCSCDAGERVAQTMPAARVDSQPGEEEMSHKVLVKIGDKTFSASLEDNPATAKFREMLPLTLDMSDLNANEKYYHLDTRSADRADEARHHPGRRLVALRRQQPRALLRDVPQFVQLHAIGEAR